MMNAVWVAHADWIARCAVEASLGFEMMMVQATNQSVRHCRIGKVTKKAANG